MHYHNKTYRAIDIGYDCPHIIGTTMATILIVSALTATAAATVGTSLYSAAQEKSQQKKLLAHQESQVKAAEAKVAGAEKLAEEKAATEIKRKRQAMTQTILTSPLGIQEEASVGMPRLLGGG